MGSSISSVRVLTSSREQIEKGTVLDTTIEALWDNAAKDLVEARHLHRLAPIPQQ